MLPRLPDELCSWKEIASYLGVSVKTAQVWESTRGLPVRRLPGPRAQVRALVGDLEAWKASADSGPAGSEEQREQPPEERAAPVAARDPGGENAPSRWWWRWRSETKTIAAACVVALAAVLALGSGLGSRGSQVTGVRVDGNLLLGLDERGEVLWRHNFGNLQADAYTDGETRAWVGDLDQDGANEILFIPTPIGFVREDVPLVCLNSKGQERWRFRPGKTVTLGSEEFRPPFVARQFAVIDGRIVVTSHHHLYHPAQVALLDSSGRMLRDYWHPGHLNVLTAGTYHGRPVAMMGGVNNRERRAALVVLDLDSFGGCAGDEAGRPSFADTACGGPERVAARLLLPRSSLNPKAPYNFVRNISRNDREVIVDVHEMLDDRPNTSILYHMDDEFQLQRVVVSDSFLMNYGRTGRKFVSTEQEGLHTIIRRR